MARNTAQVYPNSATNAEIRAWAALLNAILTAGGFTQTADTGQSDFSTITAPTVTNETRGYQIWQSTTPSGLNPWFLKIEVGSGGAAARPAVWLTVGWGTDLAGNLTGNVSSRYQIAASGNSAVTLTDCNLWADGDEISVNMFQHATSYYFAFNIERVRDATGAKTDQIFLWAQSSSHNANIVIPRTGTIPTTSGMTGVIGQRNVPASAAQFDSNYGISTIAPLRGSFLVEANNIFGADSTNYTGGQSLHTVTAYGVVRTYILGQFQSSWAPNYRLLTRYDT